MPSNWLRVFLYRTLCGYRISPGSRIDFGALLDCAVVDVRDAWIGRANYIQAGTFVMEPGSSIRYLNKVMYVTEMRLGQGACIQSRNTFVGTAIDTPFRQWERFILGERSIITRGHSFDVTDSIVIGSNVTFGGSGSRIWTHGFDPNHIQLQAPVTLGDDIYVGSDSTIVAGTRIVGNVAIGCGTVVSTSITEPGFYVSSRLIRKSDTPDYSHREGLIEFNGARYVRK